MGRHCWRFTLPLAAGAEQLVWSRYEPMLDLGPGNIDPIVLFAIGLC